MRLPEVQKPVAYFSAEFAIDNDLPTYAGGLGILAGDLLNSAASQHFPMVGVGILYKGKHFLQHISGEGKEEERDSEFDHDTSFLRPTTFQGKAIKLKIPAPDGDVYFKSYHIRLSDTTIIFFLSTDVDGNSPEWISDMDALYRGDHDSQIRQQILLGVGGIMLLNFLGITPSCYHLNEGRPEFLIWELVNQLMLRDKLTFEKAWEKAKSMIVYTNHTLVQAGNPTYNADTVRYWSKPFAKLMEVDNELLISPGLTDDKSFSITQFALNISVRHSSVSKVHGDYCRKQYPQYEWCTITNGVNLNRWQDSDFRSLSISDKELWNLHLSKKNELLKSVIKRTGFGYDPNRLVITWARRLAEYKQPMAIFKDIGRLKSIISNSDRPVQILFSGNSHSEDPNAKALIENLIRLFSTDLVGNAIFVPNYNISLANHLTSGSDVWLNTPKGNLEACGTSGMKAISNGCLNCTVLDGWTYEVDWTDIGWTLNPDDVATNFYDLLEDDIAPLYYTRNAEGLPGEWLKRMRKSIDLAQRFSTDRMLNEYEKLLYRD